MKSHLNARAVFFTVVILALGLSVTGTAFAQVESGTINGSVLDNSGAIISGARVTITNTATAQVRTTETNTSGEYSVPFLSPGTYDVEASKDGFATLIQRGVVLQVNQTLAINITLKPGSLKQTLEVTGEAPPLQTETAVLGNVVNGQQVQTLPLNGRNFMDLASLTAGTTPAEPGSRNQGEGGFSSNGNRSYDNNIMLDGVDNNSLSPDLRNGTDFIVSPPPDAIQEFNVETTGYGPEFGRGGGAAINIAIKSGTNAFHGNVWEYLRNEKLDARNFFDTTDTKTPPYKQNQFGFTFGGPIIRNHTFFFGDYQGTRIRSAETFVSPVPTLAERTGDFSDGFLGNSPFPTDPATGNPITPGDPNIDPLALKLAQLYPIPNIPGSCQGNNCSPAQFVYNPVQAINSDQFDVRVDHSFGQSMPAFVRVSQTRTHLNNPGQLPGLALGSPGTLQGNTMQNNSTGVAIGLTRVFSPTIVNDLRVGYARLEITQLPFFGNVNTDAQYGIPGIPFVSGLTGGLPVLTFSDVQQLGAEGCVPTIEITNVFTYRDVLSLTRAKHKMSMGFEGRPSEFTIFQPCDGRGHWSYGGAFTGSGFADFLLQLPGNADLATLHNIDYKRSNYGIFFGDNWHATTRLNVNAGLRWEYHSPVWERKNQQAVLGFDGNYYLAGPGTVPAGFIFPVKQSPWGKYLNEPHRRDFAPRLGLAYQLNPTTIVRAAYGIFWQAEEIGTYSNPSPGFNPPYYILAVFPSQAGPTVNATVNKLTNGFPSNAITSGFDPTSVGYTRLQPDFADGYVQEWNLTVQRQIGARSSIEVAYMGNKGTHLINGATGNQATPSPDVKAPFQPRRPIPSLFAETFDILSNAYANYNGLGITFRRNFSHGLSANVAYTWSHALDIASSSNLGSGNNGYYRSELHQNWEYGNADIDQRHRFTAYYDWQLPFGHGRAIGTHASDWVDHILGGWSTLGIWSLHTGNYFTPVINNDFSNSGAPQARPDLTCNPNNNAPHTVANWVNTSCFALPARGTFGNAGRNILLGPGYFNANLSLLKDFHFTELRYLQFRVEFFNAFNHTNFSGLSGLTAITPPETPISQGAQTPDTLNVSTMGKISSSFAPRQIQLALKFYF